MTAMSMERYTRLLMDTSSAFPIHFLKIYSAVTNRRRKRRLRTFPGRKKCGRQGSRRVPGDILERLRYAPKEQAIEHTWVVEAQGTKDMRQRKDDMDVGNVKHLTLPSGEPGRLGGPMALGAVAIATGVI